MVRDFTKFFEKSVTANRGRGIFAGLWGRMAVALAMLGGVCLATSVELIPVKKKGAGPLFRIYHGGKAGFMDRTGKVVIRPQFHDAGDFFDGLARVELREGQESKTCFIDEKGKIVIPCRFDAALDFAEGLAPVRIGRLWGYVDRKGKMVIPPRFQGAAEIRDGLGRVLVWERIQCSREAFTKDDAPLYTFTMHHLLFHATSGCFAEHPRHGYVNLAGELVIPPSFFEAQDFSEGLAVVRVGESGERKFGFIDKSGRLVIPARFDRADGFTEGMAAVETGARVDGERKVEGKFGFIGRSGEFVIPPRFADASPFSEGLASVREDKEGWGFIDKTGRLVIGSTYISSAEFSDGVAGVVDWAGEFAYIDRTGKRVLRIPGGRWPFSDGLTVAGEYDRRVYVNRRGRVVAAYEKDNR